MAESGVGQELDDLCRSSGIQLREWIVGQKTASVALPSGFTATVGTTVPATITLYPIAASAGVTTPGATQYAVMGDRIVLVGPTDRKIVYVLSAAGSQQASAQNPPGTATGGQITVQQPTPSIRVDPATILKGVDREKVEKGLGDLLKRIR